MAFKRANFLVILLILFQESSGKKEDAEDQMIFLYIKGPSKLSGKTYEMMMTEKHGMNDMKGERDSTLGMARVNNRESVNNMTTTKNSNVVTLVKRTLLLFFLKFRRQQEKLQALLLGLIERKPWKEIKNDVESVDGKSEVGIPVNYNPKLSQSVLLLLAPILQASTVFFEVITSLPQPVQTLLEPLLNFPLNILDAAN